MLPGAKWVLQHGRIVGAGLIVAAAVLLLVAFGVGHRIPSALMVWAWLSRWWVTILSGVLFAGGVTAWVWGRRSETIVETAPTGQAEEQQRTSPASSKPRRSNEFWLALAGIAATLIVGTIGSTLTYSTSTHQIKAESDRAALNFNREQRKNAYADFLIKLSGLENAEYKVSEKFEIRPFDINQAEDQVKINNEAFDDFSRASSTVRLLASPEVAEARVAIRDKHKNIQNCIAHIMAVARATHPENAIGLAIELQSQLDLIGSKLVPHFIEVARIDLGLAGN